METNSLGHGETMHMAMAHYRDNRAHTLELVEMTSSKQYHEREREADPRWHQRLVSLVLRRGSDYEPDLLSLGRGGKTAGRKHSLPIPLIPNNGFSGNTKNPANGEEFKLTVQDCYDSYLARYHNDLDRHVSDNNGITSPVTRNPISSAKNPNSSGLRCGCALSLQKIFGDDDSETELASFHRFLQEQHSAENLDFFMAVCYYHENPTNLAYQFVHKTFVHHNSANEVNLSETLRLDLASRYGEWVVPRRCVFDLCARHILHIMETDCYPRFLKEKARIATTTAGATAVGEGSTGSVFAPSQAQFEVPTEPHSLSASRSASPVVVHAGQCESTPRLMHIATLRALGRRRTTPGVASGDALGGI